MGTVATYDFNSHQIRTIKCIDGRVWWGMKDLIVALELEETATRWWLWLECNEKCNKSFLGRGGRQYLRVVSRAGVYKMLKDSPVSSDFKCWAAGIFRGKSAGPPGKKEILTPSSDGLLTATSIGQAIGGVSAQQVNQLLINLGMQRPVMDFNKKRYLLTDVGRVLGVTTIILKENGEEVSSVMWNKDIINLVEARMRAEKRNFQHA